MEFFRIHIITLLLLFLLTPRLVWSQTCDSTLCNCTSSVCTSCLSSYFYLQQSSCLICPYRCKSCTSDSNCTSQANCQASYYFNSTLGTCEACPTNCMTCSNSSSCSACQTGFAFSNGTCQKCLIDNVLTCDTPSTVATCMDSYWKNGDSCMPCRQNCQQCTGPTTCTVCSPGYLKQVAAGTFCTPCITGCLSCSTNTTCDTCALNFNLVNGVCVNITDTCTSTIKNCLYCSSSSSLTCVMCKSGYYFSGGSCIYGASLLCQNGAKGPQPFKCSYGCQWGTIQTFSQVSNDTFSCIPSYEINSGTVYQLFYYASYSSKRFTPSTSVAVCNEYTLYSTINSITWSRTFQPFYKLTVSVKLYPLYLYSYTPNGNETLTAFITFSDNATTMNSDVFNTTASNLTSLCTPLYTNVSTRNINEQKITITITSALTGNKSSNFPYGLVGVTELYIQAFRCSSDCRVCSNANYCIECVASLFVSNNQCVSSCGGLFQHYYPSGNTSNYTSKTCLSTCPDTFYPNTSTTQFICLPCQAPCTTCRSSTQCLSCRSGFLYYSQNFSCLTSCPSGYYSNGSVCLQCNTPCRTCTNQTSCLSCSIGYYNGSNCVASCPSGTYPSTSNNTCLNCSSNCLTCNVTSSNCLSCSSGTVLFGTSCLTSCPTSGYYLDTSSNTCTVCKSPCLNCLSATLCTSCIVGYLNNQSCLSSCPSGSYANTTSNTCVPCTNNCSTCLSADICLTCLTNYYLYQSSCLTTCPDFYYNTISSSGLGSCSPCSLPCSKCTSPTICLSCQTGFLSQIQKTSCLTSCEDTYYGDTATLTCQKCQSPCYTCRNTTSCLTCLSSSNTILQGSQCLTSCNTGYFNQSGICQPCSYPCTVCVNTSSTCLSCYNPFLLRGNQCLSQCASTEYVFNSTCVACSGDCFTCTNATACSSCVKIASPNATNPQKYLSNTTCVVTCPSKTFADNSTLQCRVCIFPCLTCTDSLNCLSCQIGFLNTQTNRCDFCPTSQYPDYTNKVCIACNSTISNCDACSNSTWCTMCSSSYYLYMGTCITSSKCNTIQGYYVNTQQSACLQCISPCATCVSQILCTSCLTGFLVASNQTCATSCPSGFYADSSSKTCIQCNTSMCLTCITTANTCLSCNASSSLSILFNRTCISNTSCPGQYYIETSLQSPQCLPCVAPCKTCTSSSLCLSCWSGILQNKTCVANCLPGTFSSIVSGSLTCTNCSSNCVTCVNTNTYCLSCASGSYLQNNTCVSKCDSSFYADSTSTSCLACRSPCKTCSSLLVCTSCLDGLLFVSGQCVQICPDGTYENGTICSTCPSLCQKCVMNGSSVICTICAGNKYMISTKPGQCINECPTLWYPENKTYQCYPCQSPCKTCSSATSCLTCIQGYLVYNSQCIIGDTCPDNTFRDPVLPSCSGSCTAPYYGNPLTRRCELDCIDNYLKLPEQQLCMETCPKDYYINASLFCVSCYDSKGNKLDDCKRLLNFDSQVRSIYNRLYMKLWFTQSIVSLAEHIQDTLSLSLGEIFTETDKRLLMGSDSVPLSFLRVRNSSNSLTLQLQLNNSIIQRRIDSVFENYTVTYPKVLQNLNSTSILLYYDSYPAQNSSDMNQNLITFSKILSLILLATFAAAVVLGLGYICHPLLDYFQVLFILTLINIDYAPNLNAYLFGYGFSHFLFIPQFFADPTLDSNTIRPSPYRFGEFNADPTLLGNTAPQLIILVVVIVLFSILKLLDFLFISGKAPVSDVGSPRLPETNNINVETRSKNPISRFIHEFVLRIKWNYANDLIYSTYSYLAVFSFSQLTVFGTQTGYNYISNFLAVVFIILLILIPFMLLFVLKGQKIHEQPHEDILQQLTTFTHRLKVEINYASYIVVYKYLRKLAIGIVVAAIANYPLKSSYPGYLLGLLTLACFAHLIVLLIYKPYVTRFENIYYSVMELLYFFVLISFSVVVLGYDMFDVPQKFALASVVIVLTLLLAVPMMAIMYYLLVAEIGKKYIGKDYFKCIEDLLVKDHSQVKDESDTNLVMVKPRNILGLELADQKVMSDQEDGNSNPAKPQGQENSENSDYLPYLSQGKNPPKILIKCVKNLEAGAEEEESEEGIEDGWKQQSEDNNNSQKDERHKVERQVNLEPQLVKIEQHAMEVFDFEESEKAQQQNQEEPRAVIQKEAAAEKVDAGEVLADSSKKENQEQSAAFERVNFQDL